MARLAGGTEIDLREQKEHEEPRTKKKEDEN